MIVSQGIFVIRDKFMNLNYIYQERRNVENLIGKVAPQRTRKKTKLK